MGSLAMSAFGTRLLASDMETTPSYTAIAEITNISGPEETLDTEDATSHDSEDGYETVVATILRSGNVNLDMNFVPGNSGHQQLRSDLRDRYLRDYQLEFPDDEVTASRTVFEFSAYVTSVSPEAPHAGVLTRTVGMKPSGPIVHVGVDDV